MICASPRPGAVLAPAAAQRDCASGFLDPAGRVVTMALVDGQPPNAAPPLPPSRWWRFWSPGRVEWNRVTVAAPYLPPSLEGFRILHLSDLHITRFWHKSYDFLLEQIVSSRVDLICFTGDLIDNRWDPPPAIGNLRRFLGRLESRLGTFVILGNHDGDLLAPYVSAAPVTLLHPGRAVIGGPDGGIEILGLPCVARADLTGRVRRLFPPRDPGLFRIVLSHYPDHVLRLGDLQPDLTLAGHTHGGQVCLPGGHPIITHDRLPKPQSRGVHRSGDTLLVVSRGIGFATYPVRLFASPEVIEVTLKRG